MLASEAKPGEINVRGTAVPDRVLISPDFLRTFWSIKKYVIKANTQRSPKKHPFQQRIALLLFSKNMHNLLKSLKFA